MTLFGGSDTWWVYGRWRSVLGWCEAGRRPLASYPCRHQSWPLRHDLRFQKAGDPGRRRQERTDLDVPQSTARARTTAASDRGDAGPGRHASG